MLFCLGEGRGEGGGQEGGGGGRGGGVGFRGAWFGIGVMVLGSSCGSHKSFLGGSRNILFWTPRVSGSERY